MSGYCKGCGNQHCVCDIIKAEPLLFHALLGEVQKLLNIIDEEKINFLNDKGEDMLRIVKQADKVSEYSAYGKCKNNSSILADGWRETSKTLPDKKMEVWACWGYEKENVAVMDFERELVRGKIMDRFYWRGRLSPWKVLYWMPYNSPSPPPTVS